MIAITIRDRRIRDNRDNHVICITEGSPGSRKEGICELAARLRRPRPFRKSLEITVNEPCD